MLRIDSHHHLWRPSRGDYTWLRPDDPTLAPLVRDFLPEHLQPLLEAERISKTVLVQAADSVAETEFMLDLAAGYSFIGGVVGWVDLSRSDAAVTLETWSRHPKFKGVRPMLQDLAQVDWIEHAPHPDAIHTMIRLGLRLDALVQPRHLPSLLNFARTWPQLPIVVDHAAKPRLAHGWSEDWAPGWCRCMAELAALPQVSCKFSGLLTEMSARQRASTALTAGELRNVWDALLRWFGPSRLMWGSDWPVLTLGGSYMEWLAAASVLIGELSPDEQGHLWHGAAQRFYGIE